MNTIVQDVYLGEYEEYDLYACPQPMIGPTIIARWGELGDYYSGIVFADFRPCLAEALKRALDRELLVEAGKDELDRQKYKWHTGGLSGNC